MSASNQLQYTQAEGGLLSLEFIQGVVDGRQDEVKLSAASFGLGERETLANHIAALFAQLRNTWLTVQQSVTADERTKATRALTQQLLAALGYEDRALLPVGVEGEIGSQLWIAGLQVHHDVLIWTLDAPGEIKRPLDEARPYGLSASPHSLLQSFLNASPQHLWAVLCDGHRVRLLRDHYRITRQAYLEWNLDKLFEQSNFQDFKALFLLGHATTLCKLHAQDKARIEEWMQLSQKTGVRALESLEGCVKGAIEALGAGLVRHPKNVKLREKLQRGEVTGQTLYHGVLRLIYRLIFLLVAESRDVLHPRDADPDACAFYATEYGLLALRERARVYRGSAHPDVWDRIMKVFGWLDEGEAELALPGLGSSLWHEDFIAEEIRTARIGNDAALAALRALCFTEDKRGTLHLVNWRSIGAEELGSVYESLLAYHPVLNTESREFELRTLAGNERKTSGSYYTPTSLVELLLKSALEPVLERALASAEEAAGKEAALLALTVCDPSCGSGHFLVAAAHRIAKALAQVQTGESEPPPSAYQHALRQVIARCIHGVDLNPMAVELCKVSLWMESMEPGKPLAFLDAHIQQGNSLLGVTPALMKKPIPEEAWTLLEGDDKEILKQLKAEHKLAIKQDKSLQAKPATKPKKKKEVEESAQLGFIALAEASEEPYAEAIRNAYHLASSRARTALARLTDDTLGAIRSVEQSWREYLASPSYRRAKLLADTWCAAFVWPKYTREDLTGAPTHARWQLLCLSPDQFPPSTQSRVEELAAQYHFFHWHLAFPHVFKVDLEEPTLGRSGGFDVILGNPPWEKVKIMQAEWFAQRLPYISEAPNKAERLRRIEEMEEKQHPAIIEFYLAKRAADGEAEFLRKSGAYPLCGVGSVNTYAVFSELILHLTSPTGRSGFIVPSGIATDDTTKLYFQHITQRRALAALYDFENKGLFERVDSRFKFSLLTLGAAGTAPAEIELAFFLNDPATLAQQGEDSPLIRLTAEDIARINPNTNTCPIFRSTRDARLTRDVYRCVPVLIEEATDTRPEKNPWCIDLGRMFHMSEDSHLFRTREQLESDGWTSNGNRFMRGEETYLPLYEAKMIHHYTHRWASYEGVVGGGEDDEALSTRDLSLDELRNPSTLPRPRYWVASNEVAAKLGGKWDKQWMTGWRDICRSTDERTVIASVIPKGAVSNKMPLIFPQDCFRDKAYNLIYNLSSFIYDYCARQKQGGTSLNYFIFKQLPVLPPETFDEKRTWAGEEPLAEWIKPRVVELTYTAWDMEPFAKDCGDNGPPFVWDEERRFKLRAELDAAMFHLYGIERDDVDYIMSTFPIVEKHDRNATKTEAEPEGRYITRDAILEVYDRMTAGEVIPYTPGPRHPDRDQA